MNLPEFLLNLLKINPKTDAKVYDPRESDKCTCDISIHKNYAKDEIGDCYGGYNERGSRNFPTYYNQNPMMMFFQQMFQQIMQVFANIYANLTGNNAVEGNNNRTNGGIYSNKSQSGGQNAGGNSSGNIDGNENRVNNGNITNNNYYITQECDHEHDHNQVDEPVEEIVDEPVEEIVDEPVEEIVDEPIEEIVEEPIEEIVDEPVEEIVDEPVEEIVDEPVEEIVDEPVEEIVDEPVEEIVEEPIEEIVDEPVEEPVVENQAYLDAIEFFSQEGSTDGMKLRQQSMFYKFRNGATKDEVRKFFHEQQRPKSQNNGLNPIQITEEQLEHLLNLVDKNGDGILGKDEIKAFERLNMEADYKTTGEFKNNTISDIESIRIKPPETD